MQAIVIRETGGPEALRLEDVPSPVPAPGQVRVRVAAAGVNFIDVYHRMGLYPLPMPFTPGREAAGVVEAVGEGVTRFSAGDRIAFAMEPGSYAAKVLVAADKAVAVPEGVELETAAAVMLQGMTAHYLAFDTYALKEGDVAVVLAAAGGVGHILVQIAKRLGARVIGTVSTEEKAELARAAGADDVILYRDMDLADETRRLTNGKGAHVVYDSVGADTFERSLDALRPRGMLALYGQSSGPVAPIDPQILNKKGSLFLTRPSLGHYMLTREEMERRASDLFSWIAAGELEVRIDRSFALGEAAEAHRYLEAGKTKGKVLLIP